MAEEMVGFYTVIFVSRSEAEPSLFQKRKLQKVIVHLVPFMADCAAHWFKHYTQLLLS